MSEDTPTPACETAAPGQACPTCCASPGRRIVTLLLAIAVVVWLLYRMLFQQGPLSGQEAPPFTLPTLDGTSVSLQDHLGKDVVLLDFWATWCPPCRALIPDIAEIAAEYGPKGVAVYAVNLGEPPQRVKNFLESEGLSLPVLLDTENTVGALYQVSGIPRVLIIGKDGVVRHDQAGSGPGEGMMLRRELDKALR
ncbi:MAG TPA: TlpA disulfide reductase family protein [Candidatus Hydrogenedentes bacterium]|nr:TlpA disulfide reductase family protein [Candidatus Hydrogenedentota bacterium]HRZ82529.1 TlpA disulfide reductase family protein [Candidatus Hydrogenedentota bacterium]